MQPNSGSSDPTTGILRKLARDNLFGAFLGGLLLALPAPAQESAEPFFAVHRQPAIPLVSLRMSLLVDDPPGLAGAGHLLQHIRYPSLEAQAQVVGAKVRVERTSDAIVYTVTGPTVELPYLAAILRSALEPPVAGAGARLSAERELTEERLAEWETADKHLRSTLRAHLFPADLSAAGTPASAERLSEEPLDELWARLYRPDRLAILAVGDVSLEDVRREFADLPAAPDVESSGARLDTAFLGPLAPAAATRGWFGVGYPIDDLPAAAVSVTARLLADLLQAQLPSSEVWGEHWWTHYGQALVLMVAAPTSALRGAPERLREAPAELAADLTEARVSDAARARRHDMLFYSRTPDRMAEVVGRFIDRGGDAESAQRFYAELADVGVSDVREVLESLDEAGAVRAEIPPQNLEATRR